MHSAFVKTAWATKAVGSDNTSAVTVSSVLYFSRQSYFPQGSGLQTPLPGSCPSQFPSPLQADVFFPLSTPNSHFPHQKLFIEIMGAGKRSSARQLQRCFSCYYLALPSTFGGVIWHKCIAPIIWA